MKRKLPFSKIEKPAAPEPAPDYFADLLAEQRRVLITPEHEAFLVEQQRLAKEGEAS